MVSYICMNGISFGICVYVFTCICVSMYKCVNASVYLALLSSGATLVLVCMCGYVYVGLNFIRDEISLLAYIQAQFFYKWCSVVC